MLLMWRNEAVFLGLAEVATFTHVVMWKEGNKVRLALGANFGSSKAVLRAQIIFHKIVTTLRWAP